MLCFGAHSHKLINVSYLRWHNVFPLTCSLDGCKAEFLFVLVKQALGQMSFELFSSPAH